MPPGVRRGLAADGCRFTPVSPCRYLFIRARALLAGDTSILRALPAPGSYPPLPYLPSYIPGLSLCADLDFENVLDGGGIQRGGAATFWRLNASCVASRDDMTRSCAAWFISSPCSPGYAHSPADGLVLGVVCNILPRDLAAPSCLAPRGHRLYSTASSPSPLPRVPHHLLGSDVVVMLGP